MTWATGTDNDEDFTSILQASLASRRLLVLGEKHDEPETRRLIATHLPEAYEAGARHLCLELPVSFQPVINGFVRGDLSQPELQTFLENHYTIEPEAFTTLIAAAKQSKLQMHVVDYRHQEDIEPVPSVRSDPIYLKALAHESPQTKEDIAEYYRLGKEVYANRDRADQLSSARIERVTHGEKSLVLYGDSHLVNLNNAEEEQTDTELTQYFLPADFTYVRVGSRQMMHGMVAYAQLLERLRTVRGNPDMGCNAQSRRADFVYITDEQQGYSTFDAMNNGRDLGLSLPAWKQEQPCQLSDWQQVMEGLRHLVGLPQADTSLHIPPQAQALPVLPAPPESASTTPKKTIPQASR